MFNFYVLSFLREEKIKLKIEEENDYLKHKVEARKKTVEIVYKKINDNTSGIGSIIAMTFLILKGKSLNLFLKIEIN